MSPLLFPLGKICILACCWPSRITSVAVEEYLLPFLNDLLSFLHAALILLQHAGHTADFTVASLCFLIGVFFPEPFVDSFNKGGEGVMSLHAAGSFKCYEQIGHGNRLVMLFCELSYR